MLVSMDSTTDAELIAAYADSGDESAFAEIVSRHGAMVFRACRGFVRNPHEAEDCSQAVFLVLVRKASSLGKKVNLSSWLYGVARRVSLRALEGKRNRARREEQAAMIQRSSEPEDHSAVIESLYHEMDGLSARQREAVLLRYIEGHSEKQAAALAGCSPSALSTRANDGIARLRDRLRRRGVVLTLAALFAILETEAQAAVPAALLPSLLAVSQSAAAGAGAGAAGAHALTHAEVLAEGVIQMMMWAKVKLVTGVVAAAVIVAAVAGEARDKPTKAPVPDAATAKKPSAPPAKRGKTYSDLGQLHSLPKVREYVALKQKKNWKGDASDFQLKDIAILGICEASGASYKVGSAYASSDIRTGPDLNAELDDQLRELARAGRRAVRVRGTVKASIKVSVAPGLPGGPPSPVARSLKFWLIAEAVEALSPQEAKALALEVFENEQKATRYVRRTTAHKAGDLSYFVEQIHLGKRRVAGPKPGALIWVPTVYLSLRRYNSSSGQFLCPDEPKMFALRGDERVELPHTLLGSRKPDKKLLPAGKIVYATRTAYAVPESMADLKSFEVELVFAGPKGKEAKARFPVPSP